MFALITKMTQKAKTFSKKLKPASGRPNYSLWESIKKELEATHKASMTEQEWNEWEVYISLLKEESEKDVEQIINTPNTSETKEEK
jgi:hypothetical protein